MLNPGTFVQAAVGGNFVVCIGDKAAEHVPVLEP